MAGEYPPLIARRPPPKPHLPPGTVLEAFCAGVEVRRMDRYGRWEARLEFLAYYGDGTVAVSMHLNLGRGDAPSPSLARDARYQRAWAVAAGRRPNEGEDLTPRVFDGWWGNIRLKDAKPAAGEAVYSVVAEMLG